MCAWEAAAAAASLVSLRLAAVALLPRRGKPVGLHKRQGWQPRGPQLLLLLELLLLLLLPLPEGVPVRPAEGAAHPTAMAASSSRTPTARGPRPKGIRSRRPAA